MFQPANSSFRSVLAVPKWSIGVAVLAAILITSACTRSNASASGPQGTGQTSKPTQSLPSDASATHSQSVQSPVGLSLDVVDTFREAQSGNREAMAKLGNAYERGEGAPQDFRQAVTWLDKAAEAGDSYAMYCLGRLYASGSGVDKDYREAVRWYEKAAAAGNADAMYSLGRSYEIGAGVREDVQQAVQWYDQADLHGNKEARAALARLGESIEDH
jgi:hypothetical protein